MTSLAEAIYSGRKNFPESTQTLIFTLVTEATRFLRREARLRRREMPAQFLGTDNDDSIFLPPSYNPDGSVAATLDVLNALAHLPPLLKEAIILVEVDDMSIADAARISGCSVNTMKQRIFRARKRFWIFLRDYSTPEARGGGATVLLILTTAEPPTMSNKFRVCIAVFSGFIAA